VLGEEIEELRIEVFPVEEYPEEGDAIITLEGNELLGSFPLLLILIEPLLLLLPAFEIILCTAGDCFGLTERGGFIEEEEVVVVLVGVAGDAIVEIGVIEFGIMGDFFGGVIGSGVGMEGIPLEEEPLETAEGKRVEVCGVLGLEVESEDIPSVSISVSHSLAFSSPFLFVDLRGSEWIDFAGVAEGVKGDAGGEADVLILFDSCSVRDDCCRFKEDSYFLFVRDLSFIPSPLSSLTTSIPCSRFGLVAMISEDFRSSR